MGSPIVDIIMHLVISPDNSSSALDRAGGIFYIISSLNARAGGGGGMVVTSEQCKILKPAGNCKSREASLGINE